MSDRSSRARRPFWLHGSCPSWCIGGHAEMEYESPEVWIHLGGLAEVSPLSAMTPGDMSNPWIAVVHVEQGCARSVLGWC